MKFNLKLILRGALKCKLHQSLFCLKAQEPYTISHWVWVTLGRAVFSREKGHFLLRQLNTEEPRSEGGGLCEPLALASVAAGRVDTLNSTYYRMRRLSSHYFHTILYFAQKAIKFNILLELKRESSRMTDIRLTYRNKHSSLEPEATRKTNGK